MTPTLFDAREAIHMTLGLLAADVCLMFAVILSMFQKPKPIVKRRIKK